MEIVKKWIKNKKLQVSYTAYLKHELKQGTNVEEIVSPATFEQYFLEVY